MLERRHDQQFKATHAVFRFEDFVSAHQAGGGRKAAASMATLKQHVRAGNLLRVRRGLSATVPRGQTPDTVRVDPYVLASYLAPDAVAEHALVLRSAVTVAKVGFFLEQHRAALMVEDRHLDRLRPHAPARPMYLERGTREPGKLVPGWNLVVPERVLGRTWAEVP